MWYRVEQKTLSLNDIMTLLRLLSVKIVLRKYSIVVSIYSFPLPSLNYITL